MTIEMCINVSAVCDHSSSEGKPPSDVGHAPKLLEKTKW